MKKEARMAAQTSTSGRCHHRLERAGADGASRFAVGGFARAFMRHGVAGPGLRRNSPIEQRGFLQPREKEETRQTADACVVELGTLSRQAARFGKEQLRACRAGRLNLATPGSQDSKVTDRRYGSLQIRYELGSRQTLAAVGSR